MTFDKSTETWKQETYEVLGTNHYRYHYRMHEKTKTVSIRTKIFYSMLSQNYCCYSKMKCLIQNGLKNKLIQ